MGYYAPVPAPEGPDRESEVNGTMAIHLKLKKGESVERGLKRLKKVLDKEGLLKTLRDTRYFEKPCVKARKKSERARIRNRSRRGRLEMN